MPALAALAAGPRHADPPLVLELLRQVLQLVHCAQGCLWAIHRQQWAGHVRGLPLLLPLLLGRVLQLGRLLQQMMLCLLWLPSSSWSQMLPATGWCITMLLDTLQEAGASKW